MNPIQISLMTIFHPMDGFCLIKSNRENFSYWPAVILSVLFVAVRILSMYLMHYSVTNIDPSQIDIPIEIAMLVAPVASWILVHYSITTISSGECKMREVYAGLVYAFVPYIVLMLPISLLSHLFSQSSAGIITLLQNLVWAYCIFQVFISIKAMNDFSFKKTIGIIILTFVGIVLCWVLILLLYGLTVQLVTTAYQLIREFINIYIG